MVRSLMLDLHTAMGLVQRRPNYMETIGRWGCFHAVMDKLVALDEQRQQQREQDSGCW